MDTDYAQCNVKDCENKIKNHRWGKIEADDWFFTKDGMSFCPEHFPAWVHEWRKKRAASNVILNVVEPDRSVGSPPFYHRHRWAYLNGGGMACYDCGAKNG